MVEADKTRAEDKRVLTHEAKRMSTEIPIWVNGEIRWLSGIDKKTTCKDIVEVLLDEEGIDKAELKDYTIMERWRKVERPLDENSKILKIWSHWGDEKKEVRLCLRRVDNEVDSGRGSPIGSGSTPSLRRKRHKHRGIGKPGLSHPEGLHPRRLAELGTIHRRDYDDYYVSTAGKSKNPDETPSKNYLLEHQNHANYEVYNDSENVNCRPKSTAKSYHCPSTGKLHSTPLADYTNSRTHGRRAGKCCSKRDSKHKVRNSESIEKLMKLILAQGATIQSQLQKLKERDEQIETIEHERHRERIEKNGRNYLLETYLGSLKEAEIPAEVDEERADDSGVNTEGGSDQMNAIKRKNMERLKQNETEPDSDPGPSGVRDSLDVQGLGLRHHYHHHHNHHHHHHHHGEHPFKNARSKSVTRTDESKSTVLKLQLKRTLSDNSIVRTSEPEEDLRKSSDPNGYRTKTKEDAVEDAVELNKIQSQIHMWEKVFKINKKLEKEEENLVRLHIKIKKIQSENYRSGTKDDQDKASAEETVKSDKNDEDPDKVDTDEQQQQQPGQSSMYNPEQTNPDPDYVEIKQNLETLKSDLDLNSKEIYKNFTRLIEEDELVEKKRNHLTQLLTDLERTQREEEMLNEMITVRRTHMENASEHVTFPATTAEASTIATPSHPPENLRHHGTNNLPHQQVHQEPPIGIPNQRPDEPDAAKKAQNLRPKILKISFEDTIKSSDDSSETVQEKSTREPHAVPVGALKGILKNRNKPVPNREADVYGSHTNQNDSQTYPFNYYPNAQTNNNNHFYPNYNCTNTTRIPQTGEVPQRNDYVYSTAAYATPYNPYTYQTVQNLYEPNYAPVPETGHYDVKTAYSLKGSHPHDMTRTTHPHFPHSTIPKSKILNDNDSSTSSDTSGLCSMYSSSPSVEQPYIEHGYILDTLV